MRSRLKYIVCGLLVLSVLFYLMRSPQRLDEPPASDRSQLPAPTADVPGQDGSGLALLLPDKGAQIHARVVNTATAKGVRATVCIAQDVIPSPIDCYPTDAEGEVEIANPAIQHAFRLWAAAPGFAPAVSPPPPQSPIAGLANGLQVLLEVTPSTRMLAGVVVDGSGGPIPGATLEIRTPRARSSICMADGEGQFRCTLQEYLNSVTIRVTAEGYGEVYRIILLPAEQLRVWLFTESAISGKVIDSSDRPLPNIDVRIKPSVQDMRPWTISTQTDEQGIFRFEGLTPGTYRVFAASGRYSSELSPNEVSLGYTERREDVIIRVVEGRRVRVRLEAQGGLPCQRSMVMLSPAEKKSERYFGAPAEDSWFEISGVPDGNYSLLLQCENHLDEVKALEVSTDLEISHEAKSGGVIRGVVYGDNGKPAPEAYVQAGERSVQTDSEGRFVAGGLPWGEVEIEASHRRLGGYTRQTAHIAPNLSPPDLRLVLARGYCIDGIVQHKGVTGSLTIETSRNDAEVRSDGSFEICAVRPGDRLSLRLRSDDGFRVFRVAETSLDLTVVELVVPKQDAPAPAIRLEVEDDFTNAKGSVRETTGEGVPDVLIIARSAVSSQHTCQPTAAVLLKDALAATHADGEFSIEGIRVGRHEVHAVAPDGRRACSFIIIPGAGNIVIELPALAQ